MLRFSSARSIVAAFTIFFAGFAAAAIVDRGPPYSNDQFLELVGERVPPGFRQILPEWWAKAPDYLRKRVLASPSEKWWPIILCNYMGFKPGAPGDQSAEKCEDDWYRNSQRGKANWSPDGQWLGPSEECRKRDKRSKWGELICD